MQAVALSLPNCRDLDAFTLDTFSRTVSPSGIFGTSSARISCFALGSSLLSKTSSISRRISLTFSKPVGILSIACKIHYCK